MRNKVLFFMAVGLVVLAACSDDDDSTTGPSSTAGAIDGRWLVDSFSCNGRAQQIPKLTVEIANTKGSFVIEIPGTCTATISEDYSYPKAGTLRIAPRSNACTPSGAACAPAFGGADSCPTPPPTDFDYVLTGNQLTFARTSVGPPVDTCPTGEAVEYKMTKQ